MKKILWLSKHAPLPAQLRELDRLWPGCSVSQDVSPFADASEIVRRVHAGGFQEVVVVAPLSVLHQLCQRGIMPLRAEMTRVQYLGDPQREINVNGRVMRFVGFKRVNRMELILEDI